MTQTVYQLVVESEDQRLAGKEARTLSDTLRELDGVLEAERRKNAESTMDLGVVVQIVISSGATLAIARGIADWIRRTRGTTLKIERKKGAESIKVAVQAINPEAATRITEIVVNE
jgi:hypothetical protein